MPKITERPRFRVHTRTGKNGKTWTSYYWDGRGRKAKDIPLGNDLAQAIMYWQMCEDGITPPPIARPKKPKPVKLHKKLLPLRQKGKRRKFGDEVWNGLPQWAKAFYLNSERRAQEDHRAFRLTPADLAYVIARANGRCEVSGIPLRERQAGERKRHEHSPSIDRIDSTKGYIPGNIRVVCLIANFAMNTWGEDALKTLAEHVSGNRIRQVSATSI